MGSSMSPTSRISRDHPIHPRPPMLRRIRRRCATSKVSVSVDAARSRHPLAFLSGHRGDAVEVCVIVQDNQTCFLGGRSDQKVGYFSSPLTSTREHPLHLPSPFHMTCLGLN